MQVDVVMPKCGLTMTEATIIRWVRAPGHAVAEGDPLVEVETEKVNMEVPAPSAGMLVRVVAEVGTVVPVGEVIAVLEVLDSLGSRASVLADLSSERGDTPVLVTDSTAAFVEKGQRDNRGGRASPLARRVAREIGIDIASVHGTGPNGLITEADVRAAKATPEADATTCIPRPVRTERLTRVRKAIATAMGRRLAEAAQITIMREVGVAGVSAVRAETKDQATLTDILLAAVAHTLAHHPRLNAHLIGDELRLFDTINLGLAVAVDEGLVTPVIRDVCGLRLAEIAAQRRQLVDKARGGTLRQPDLEGATFTITNLGAYGIDTFTPILNPPEVAILGIGAARARPMISGAAVVVRDTCSLSLTFDHRALDGAPAAVFLADLGDLLDDPGRLKERIQ